MSEARRPARGGRRASALPDDDEALAELAALAKNAFGPPQAATLTAVPAVPLAADAGVPAGAAVAPAPSTAPGPSAAASLVTAVPAAPVTAVPAPPAAPVTAVRAPVAPVTAVPALAAEDNPRQDDAPGEGSAGLDFVTQATIQVGASVAIRFKAYQRTEEQDSGIKPSNAEVIFRALDELHGRYSDIIAARRPQLPEGRTFGRPVAGRRVAGTELKSQINYRPTVGERAAIKGIWQAAGADSESSFIHALLDEFLPAAEPKPGRTRPRS